MRGLFGAVSDWRSHAGRMLRDTSGTTAIEYSIIAGGIAAVLITVVFSIGSTIKTAYYDKILGAF